MSDKFNADKIYTCDYVITFSPKEKKILLITDDDDDDDDDL
jgi:hypothetical protein